MKKPFPGKQSMPMKDPAEASFEYRMKKMQDQMEAQKRGERSLVQKASQAYDANAAELARRAANVRKAQEEERQAKIRDQAEMMRRSENVRRARGGK